MKRAGVTAIGVLLIAGVVFYWFGEEEYQRAPRYTVESDSADRRGQSGGDVAAIRRDGGHDPTTAETQAFVTSPFSSNFFHLGERTLDQLQAKYFDNIEQARTGDAEAMLLISRVLTNCQHALSFENQDTAYHSFENGLMSYAAYEETLALMAECEPIVQDVLQEFPKRKRYEVSLQVVDYWLARSAEEGNRYARLELLVDLPGQGKEIAELLDELVDTEDPHVFFKASEFISVRSALPSSPERQRWAYLGCINHPGCDVEVYENNLKLTYSQADQIIEFAKNFESLAKSEISFKSIYKTQPYTAYTPQEIETYKLHIRNNNKEDSVGRSVFWD